MSDRPIIFSGPMVRALLAGRKTQTRRLAKFIEQRGPQMHVHSRHGGWIGPEARVAEIAPDYAPYAKGDRLWMKETWQAGSTCDGPAVAYRADSHRWYPEFTGPDEGVGPSFDYDAHPAKAWNHGHWIADVEAHGPWGSSLHMPRWASRLTLIVEDVRVQRLQTISDDDVWAEGICSAVEEDDRENGKPAWGDIPRHYRRLIVEQTFGSAPRAFHWLWSGLHDKPGQRWGDDPFVVALTFRVVHGNIDRIEA